MKTNVFLTVICCLAAVVAFAQQRAQSSFDHVNPFNLNPAYAGFDSCGYAFAQHKQQWVGVEGAPTNTQLQGLLPLQPTLGLGLNISSWQAGVLRATNLAIHAGKHVQLNSKLRLGGAVGLGYYRYTFGMNDVVAFDSDTYLNQSAQSNSGVFGNLGLLLSSDRTQAGIALPNVFGTPLTFEAAGEQNQFDVERYFNVHASHRLTLADQLSLTPQFIYRSIPGHGAMMDIKANLRLRDVLGVSAGFRTQSGLIAAIDLRLNDRFQFGYAYDAGMARLNGISNGSHEVLLGIRICKQTPPPPEPVQYYTSGTATDSYGQPLSNLSVVVTNLATGETQTVQTDSAGRYTVPVDAGGTYTIAVNNANFEAFTTSVVIDANTAQSTTNLALTNKVQHVTGLVVDAESGQPLSGVAVGISNKTAAYTAVTDARGIFELELPGHKQGDVLDYTVELTNTGYLPYSDHFNATLTNYEPMPLNMLLKGGLKLTPEKQPEQLAEIIDLKPIRFEVNSARLTEAAKVELDKVVGVLQSNPEMRIEIGAHTDCTGNDESNMRLSEKRASSTLEYIKARVDNPERITGKGYGESMPVRPCNCADCTPEDHALNRRTEFRIVR